MRKLTEEQKAKGVKVYPAIEWLPEDIRLADAVHVVGLKQGFQIGSVPNTAFHPADEPGIV